MIGIWYNPKSKNYYSKSVKTAFLYPFYKVGYINNYGHELVALFALEKNRLISCESWQDYYTNKKDYYKPKNIKKRFIKWLIKLLERSV